MSEHPTEEKLVDTTPWREGAISLEILNDHAKVFVERSGRMVCVISTVHGGVTSHCVHPSGIDRDIKEYAEDGP